MLLLLLAMGILFGGAEEAWDMEDMVLAVSAVIEGERMDDPGDVIDWVVIDGDFIW